MTAVNAIVVEDETLGESEGVAGQRFPLPQRPVVAGGRCQSSR